MKMFRFLFFTLILSILLPPLAQSQTDEGTDSPSLGWVTLGLGYAGNKDLAGLGGCASASYLSDLGLLSLRFLGASKVGKEPALTIPTRLEDFSELSGLYGISYRPLSFFLSASTGFGVVWITERGLFGRKTSATIGVPLEAQVFITPFRVLGIGLNAFGNLNGTSSYGGIFFCVQLGKLR